jgi:hypothetical protein
MRMMVCCEVMVGTFVFSRLRQVLNEAFTYCLIVVDDDAAQKK